MQRLIYDMCSPILLLEVEVPYVLCVAYYIQRRYKSSGRLQEVKNNSKTKRQPQEVIGSNPVTD